MTKFPIFVRHGLVTLSIDGFDELGDPNGYDLAWGQVNELVTQIRGRGTARFGGARDVHRIWADQVENHVPEKSGVMRSTALTLLPPEPDTAKGWLRMQGLDGGRPGGGGGTVRDRAPTH